MDEIISGVQVIKMYAWEKPFCALIELARRLELKGVTKSSYIRGIYMTFNIFTTRMALYCTLVAMLLSGERLTADTVFVFSAYFAILAHTMSGMFVRGVAEIAECMVAVRRLQTFLVYEEFQSGNVTNDLLLSTSNGTINSDSRYNSIKASKQDLPYIDEDVHEEEERANIKKSQSFVLVNELFNGNEADTSDKHPNNPK
jgi:ATP-binding cassette subfamily C (CFTR/MRP) protein 4